MSTVLSPKEETLRQEWLAYVTESLVNGVRPDLVTDELVRRGWARRSAHQFVWGIENEMAASPDARSDLAEEYKKHMLFGSLWMVGGGAVSLVVVDLTAIAY